MAYRNNSSAPGHTSAHRVGQELLGEAVKVRRRDCVHERLLQLGSGAGGWVNVAGRKGVAGAESVRSPDRGPQA